MPPVVFFGLLVAAAGISAYKLLSGINQKARTQASGERVRRAHASPRDLGSLEWDEAQGVYRPRIRRER